MKKMEEAACSHGGEWVQCWKEKRERGSAVAGE